MLRTQFFQATMVKTKPLHQFLLQKYFYCSSIHHALVFPVKRSLQIPTKVILSLMEPGWSYPLQVNMCFKIVPSFDSDTRFDVNYHVKAAHILTLSLNIMYTDIFKYHRPIQLAVGSCRERLSFQSSL